MKKLFLVLALTGMVSAVSATTLSAVNGTVIVFNGGDGDGKKKEKDKKACTEKEGKGCCKKDGATGTAATSKDGKTCTEGEKSGKSCCKKGETEKKATETK